MTTYKVRLEAGLLALGWTRDEADRSKYSAWVKLGMNGKYLVGEKGALRYGRNASNSRSYGDPSHQAGFYSRVLAAGDLHLQQPPARLVCNNGGFPDSTGQELA